MSVERKTVCPFCGTAHNLVGSVREDSSQPEDGDISLCFRCGEWMILDSTKEGAHAPNDEDYEYIAANEIASSVREAWLEVRKDVNT